MFNFLLAEHDVHVRHEPGVKKIKPEQTTHFPQSGILNMLLLLRHISIHSYTNDNIKRYLSRNYPPLTFISEEGPQFRQNETHSVCLK